MLLIAMAAAGYENILAEYTKHTIRYPNENFLMQPEYLRYGLILRVAHEAREMIRQEWKEIDTAPPPMPTPSETACTSSPSTCPWWLLQNIGIDTIIKTGKGDFEIWVNKEKEDTIKKAISRGYGFAHDEFLECA